MSSTAVSSNNISSALVAELEHEAAVTRTCLERVPADKFDWKPHEKAMTLGWLATFSAVLWTWGSDTVLKDEFDVMSLPPEARNRKPAATTADLVALFDRNLAAAREAIAKTSDERFATAWTLRAGEHVIFSQPRWKVLRTYVFRVARKT